MYYIEKFDNEKSCLNPSHVLLLPFDLQFIQITLFCRPDTQSYIQKMEQEKAEKAKGQQADNRSFIAKYVSCYTYRTQNLIHISYSIL